MHKISIHDLHYHVPSSTLLLPLLSSFLYSPPSSIVLPPLLSSFLYSPPSSTLLLPLLSTFLYSPSSSTPMSLLPPVIPLSMSVHFYVHRHGKKCHVCVALNGLITDRWTGRFLKLNWWTTSYLTASNDQQLWLAMDACVCACVCWFCIHVNSCITVKVHNLYSLSWETV